jgi:hypothetical protein
MHIREYIFNKVCIMTEITHIVSYTEAEIFTYESTIKQSYTSKSFCLVLGLTLIVKCTNSTSCISFGFALHDRKTDNYDGKSFLIKLCTYIYYIFY